MNRLFSLRVTCIFPLAIAMLLSACGKAPDSSGEAPRARPAKLITIGQKDEDEFLNYPATVKAENVSALSFEVSGVVEEISVVESQRVEEGDILAKLDERDLLTQLQSAQAQFDSANSEFERAERLIKEDAISKSDYEQRLSARDVNKAKLDTSQKALEDAVLIAPFSGNIAEVLIKEKQAIQSSTTAITILGQGGMEATINLPASIMAHAQKTDRIEESTYLVFSFAPEQRIPALFKEANLSADSASQTYSVTFTFSSPDNMNVLPGMNATLWFKDPRNVGNETVQLAIPITSVGIDGDQQYVWVVDNTNMSVSRRVITVQDGVGEMLVVTSGLQMGDTIVAAGISSISAGMKVQPWSK